MYTVVDDNDDFIVVAKCSGVSIHYEGETPGLIELLRRDIERSGIVPVHRLDKATSGLLICAKNLESNRLFCDSFRARHIEKYYLAVSDKKPKKKQGLIIGDMRRSRKGNQCLSGTTDNPGITQFFSYGASGKRLFVLKPHTGKTHQLRVALKSIQAPIVGDQRYCSVGQLSNKQQMLLHAYSLRFHFREVLYSYGNCSHGSVVDFTRHSHFYSSERVVAFCCHGLDVA